MTEYVSKALRGISESLTGPRAPRRPPETKKALGEAPAPSRGCRCFPTLGSCPDCPGGCDACGVVRGSRHA